MSEKLLSVVVPTYNMEAYLRRCLDSVTRDDVPSSLELIVVNDGSTDDSLAIMQEYAEKYPDIVNIIDKPNGHYGSCVNVALKVATGKYFRILDADDWFDTDGLIELLKGLEQTNSDVVVVPYKKHYRTHSRVFAVKNIQFNKQYDICEEPVWKSQRFDCFLMHSVIYKLSIIKKSRLKMTEGICFTDTEYLIYPSNYANSITFFEKVLYNYDLTREGQSIDPSGAMKNHKDIYAVIKRMEPFFSQFDAFAIYLTTNLLVLYYYRMLFLCIDDIELKKIDSLLKKQKPNFLKNLNKAMLGTPILWRLFGIHFLFYEKLKRFFKIDR